MGGSKLTATDLSTDPAPWFGYAISMNNAGTVLAVGAPFDGTIVGTDSYANGKVVIFRLSGSTWTQDAIFQGSPLAPSTLSDLAGFSSLFGFAISLNGAGDLAVVGAPCK